MRVAGWYDGCYINPRDSFRPAYRFEAWSPPSTGMAAPL